MPCSDSSRGVPRAMAIKQLQVSYNVFAFFICPLLFIRSNLCISSVLTTLSYSRSPGVTTRLSLETRRVHKRVCARKSPDQVYYKSKQTPNIDYGV
ncbi:hypothetical protein LB504_004814 [Fusarium proliferatum]|nr:hypothetical protein LB504_004814 [Fusarium proliferatum]